MCGLTHFGVPPRISFSARKTLSKMSTIRSTTSSRFARVDCFGSRSKLYVLSWSKLYSAWVSKGSAFQRPASFASFRFFVVDVQREVGEPDGIREIRENHGDEREARFRAQEQPRRHRRIEHRQKRREEQLERAGGVRAGRRGGERVDIRAGRGGGDTATARLDRTMPICGMVREMPCWILRACVSGFASDTSRPPLLATAKKARITSVHEEARLSGGIGFWTPESRALADFPTTELD